MSRQKDYTFQKESKEKRITQCKDCNGSPPLDTFNLQGMCGNYCTICMEVVNWIRNAPPIRVKEKKIIDNTSYDSTKYQDPQFQGVVSIEEREIIPGVNFNQLEI